MDPIYIILVAFFPVLVGGFVIWGMVKGISAVNNRPVVLAGAGAPLGLALQPDAVACAEAALSRTIHPWADAVAAVRGRVGDGDVTIVDLRYNVGGRSRYPRMMTVAVYHGPSGLPRMVLQPRRHEQPAQLTEISCEEGDDATLEFGMTYVVHGEDEAAVRARVTAKVTAALAILDGVDQAPCLDVLPDRIAYCRPRSVIEPDQLAGFVKEGRKLIALLRGA